MTARHGVAMTARRKRVTARKADKALAALVEIIECADLGQYASGSDLVAKFDHVADELRRIRDLAPVRSSAT